MKPVGIEFGVTNGPILCGLMTYFVYVVPLKSIVECVVDVIQHVDDLRA